MDLTHISVGKIELKKEKIDLIPLVQDVVTQLKLTILNSSVNIHFESAPKICGEFDPTRMSQVVVNLLNNAIKYGEQSPIEVRVQDENHHAVIYVQDYGPGIPVNKQALIFERFERANEDANVSGLGLGLYITQQIVEAHNGKLTLSSQIKKGSTFKVSIPLT